MKKLRQSLIIFAGQLLFASALTLTASHVGYSQKAPTQVTVTNTSSQPVPVIGTVNIGSAIHVQPVIPDQFFNNTWNFSPYHLEQIVSSDQGGTNYAITSVTATNFATEGADVYIYAYTGDNPAPLPCVSGAYRIPGPHIYLLPYQTVHLTFPQPYVFQTKSAPYEYQCVSSVGGAATISVVGYKF